MDLARKHFCLQCSEVSTVGSQRTCRLAGQEQCGSSISQALGFPALANIPFTKGGILLSSSLETIILPRVEAPKVTSAGVI